MCFAHGKLLFGCVFARSKDIENGETLGFVKQPKTIIRSNDDVTGKNVAAAATQ